MTLEIGDKVVTTKFTVVYTLTTIGVNNSGEFKCIVEINGQYFDTQYWSRDWINENTRSLTPLEELL